MLKKGLQVPARRASPPGYGLQQTLRRLRRRACAATASAGVLPDPGYRSRANPLVRAWSWWNVGQSEVDQLVSQQPRSGTWHLIKRVGLLVKDERKLLALSLVFMVSA